jgi:hypothetical protein
MPLDLCAPQRPGLIASRHLGDRRRVRIRFVAVDETHAYFVLIG